MASVSAAPYLALLTEEDQDLKVYALNSLNNIVDQLWAEIANNIVEIEELYQDKSFQKRELAALVASKVYYNLGDYDSSVKFSLVSGDEFNINENSEYIETIVSKCINKYIELSQSHYHNSSVKIDEKLTLIFEKMLEKCVKSNELKLALGISLESYRLDLIESILKHHLSSNNEESSLNLINYVLTCSNTVIESTVFRNKVLNTLVSLILSLKNPDYFIIFKIIVQLNDADLSTKLFTHLIEKKSILIAYQVAFDLVSSASQELLENTIELLSKDPNFAKGANESKLLKILTGIPTCDLDVTFLHNNNNTDISILNKTKSLLDGRNSIFHSAVTFENAFLHCGTTDDSFFRRNLEWLGKASNWSKFSATAALGVIHKGNLSQGRTILQPYLPGSSGSPHTKGGSLFALGLIFAGHGRETIDYLRQHVVENGNSAGNSDIDIILHGACLGVGVAGMGSGNRAIYDELKAVLYSDSAISGQAAGLSMGLIMLGSGDQASINDMLQYAQETQHETIIRGLAIGIALLNYGKEDDAKVIIDTLMSQEDAILRYGGAFTLALAYAGTGNNNAIKKLLHFAVSDPSDDVRRASVLALGFILIRDYTTVPQIVGLLSESHNPHVRYGTALALGISCAGRGLPAAVEVLEPLTKDPVDFVRQGALIAMSMILIQETEKTSSKVKDIRQLFASTVKNKNQDALAKFGAALAQGIIDAGGRNVSIQLENLQTNTINMKSIVGLAIFVQSWYWFPLTHFLSLSFTPTSIIGIKEDLKVPTFDMNCHTKPDLFDYPPKVEESKEKQPDKIEVAVLSTTKRAKNRAKKSKAKKQGEEDKMDVDEETPKAVAEDNPVTESTSVPLTAATDSEEVSSTRYSKQPYKVTNMSRVVPTQAKYISFPKEERFIPVRKFRGNIGLIVLRDTRENEPVKIIKTVRQLNNKDAPVPEPFTITEDDEDDDDENN